jgi:polysaccharide biosynthesis transport protein
MGAHVEDENTGTFGARIEVLRRRWKYPALIAPAFILASIFVAFVMTPLFRSSGTIMLEPSSVPQQFVEVATSYADQQFEIVQRRVMTPASLLELVQKVDPYPRQKDITPREKARMISENTEIERVDPITLETLQESNAFSIHYDNPDPQLAQAISKELVRLFLDYNARTRRERAQGTYHFLLAESGKLSDSIREMETKLAEFKSRYGDALPQAQPRNLAALDAAQRNYESAQAQARVAQQKVSMLELQLSDLSPSIAGTLDDKRLDLPTLRAALADAERRYTPEHPDVRRLRRAVADYSKGGSTSRSATRPDNPEYMRVESELNGARRELAALRADASRASAQIQAYQQSLERTPSVEREYLQLARNYELAQENFREVQGKLTEASLARSLVAEEQGERFTMIREPGLPSSAEFPNRLGIILLGTVLGAALGFGAAMLVELSDPMVRGASDLQALTGHTMLVAVPNLLNRAEQRSRRFRYAVVAAAFGVALVMVGAAVLRSGA